MKGFKESKGEDWSKLLKERCTGKDFNGKEVKRNKTDMENILSLTGQVYLTEQNIKKKCSLNVLEIY